MNLSLYFTVCMINTLKYRTFKIIYEPLHRIKKKKKFDSQGY